MMIRKLREVCQFYSGTGFPIACQGKNDGDLPFYKVGDIASNVVNGNIYLSLCNNYISRQEATKLKGSIIPKDTIVFAKIGEALKLNRRAITSSDCLIDNNAMGIAPKAAFLRTRYFYYFMKHLKMQNYAESTTVPSVRKSKLEQVEIEVPALVIQEKVERILNKAAALVNVRQQQLQKLDELVKARFVEMFGDYIPKDGKPLSELATITGGLTKNSNRKTFDLKMPYLRVANVFFNRLDLNEVLEIGVREEEIEKTLLQAGDLLFVEGNGSIEQIGRVAIWNGSIHPILHQNHLIKARFSGRRIVPEFALFYFMTHEGRQQIKSKSVSTSGLNTLSVSKVGSLILPVPPISLQEQFAAFVKQNDKTKAVIQKALDEAQLLFDSLMQKYFG